MTLQPLRPDHAETLALRATAWLASDEELLPVFLGATGASERDLRDGLHDPAFLGAVLDFLLMDDAWVTAVAGALGVDPSTIARARAGLPGGSEVHWT